MWVPPLAKKISDGNPPISKYYKKKKSCGPLNMYKNYSKKVQTNQNSEILYPPSSIHTTQNILFIFFNLGVL